MLDEAAPHTAECEIAFAQDRRDGVDVALTCDECGEDIADGNYCEECRLSNPSDAMMRAAEGGA